MGQRDTDPEEDWGDSPHPALAQGRQGTTALSCGSAAQVLSCCYVCCWLLVSGTVHAHRLGSGGPCLGGAQLCHLVARPRPRGSPSPGVSPMEGGSNTAHHRNL